MGYAGLLFKNLANQVAAIGPTDEAVVDNEGDTKEKKRERDPDESSALSDYELSHEKEQPNREVQRERLKGVLRKL